MLNSDVEVTPNWLLPLIEILKNNSNIACVQPKIKSYHNKNYFEHAGAAGGFLDYLGYPYCRGRILNVIEEDKDQYNTDLPVFWTSGACMLIRKKIFDEVDGFDSIFFAHMEEIDLCWRIQKAGYSCWYTNKSTVYHVGGGTLPYESPQKVYLNFRNNLFMLIKNLPFLQILYILPIRLCLDGLAGILFLYQKKPMAFLYVIKAHLSFYKKIPTMWCKRKKGTTIKRTPFSVMYYFFVRKKKNFSQIIA